MGNAFTKLRGVWILFENFGDISCRVEDNILILKAIVQKPWLSNKESIVLTTV